MELRNPETLPVRKLSKLALASFLLPLLIFFLLRFRPSGSEGFIILLALFSIPLGHIALWRITRSARQIRGKPFAIAGLCLGYGLVFLLYSSPLSHHSRVATNESSAIGTIRTLNLAEAKFAGHGDNSRYACSLSELTATLRSNSTWEESSLDDFVNTGTQSGYVYQLSCEVGSEKGYSLIAVPEKLGSSGMRSFCSDRTGVIRYSNNGESKPCEQQGKPLE
jgi:hypothetical protein